MFPALGIKAVDGQCLPTSDLIVEVRRADQRLGDPVYPVWPGFSRVGFQPLLVPSLGDSDELRHAVEILQARRRKVRSASSVAAYLWFASLAKSHTGGCVVSGYHIRPVYPTCKGVATIMSCKKPVPGVDAS